MHLTQYSVPHTVALKGYYTPEGMSRQAIRDQTAPEPAQSARHGPRSGWPASAEGVEWEGPRWRGECAGEEEAKSLRLNFFICNMGNSDT